MIASSPQILRNQLLEFASQPISDHEILDDLEPPKHFQRAEFSNYIPEPDHPSQAIARESVEKFINALSEIPSQNIFNRFWKSPITEGTGLYLDGGFGVGKTHLLAAAYNKFSGAKAYLSFEELMFLVGLQSLTVVASTFKNLKLLVIDEFELDDQANTRISTNLLGQLLDSGVSILASSNTPPGALGEGKFSVADFKRELGNLTKRFKTLRIDGEDYRVVHHLGEGAGSKWTTSDTELLLLTQNLPSGNILDIGFDDFLSTLAKVHPMRIRRAIGKFDAVVLHNVKQISHPYAALRFVYFIDKAYDYDLNLLASSEVGIDEIFQHSYFSGGDTKKYLRAMSRLKEMSRSGFR